MSNKTFDAFQKYISENFDLYEKDIMRQIESISNEPKPQNSVEIAAMVSYLTCMSILRKYHEWMGSN